MSFGHLGRETDSEFFFYLGRGFLSFNLFHNAVFLRTANWTVFALNRGLLLLLLEHFGSLDIFLAFKIHSHITFIFSRL